MLKHVCLHIVLLTYLFSYGGNLYVTPGSAFIGYRCLKNNEQICRHRPNLPYQALTIRPTTDGWWVTRIIQHPQLPYNSPIHISYQSFEYRDDDNLSKTFLENCVAPIHVGTPVLDTQRHQYETARLTEHGDICDYRTTIQHMFAAWKKHEHNKQRSPLKIYIESGNSDR